MGLEKAIGSGKEHRKKFHGAKAVDRMCRNHGGCSYCTGNRLYSTIKKTEAVKYRERIGTESSLPVPFLSHFPPTLAPFPLKYNHTIPLLMI